MFISYNPNPDRKLVGDCVIRAITKVTDSDWNSVYMDICLTGYSMKDMPSSNSVAKRNGSVSAVQTKPSPVSS